MRLKVDLTSGDFEEPNGDMGPVFINNITADDFEKILRSAFQNGEKTIEFSNGSLPRDCIKRWKLVTMMPFLKPGTYTLKFNF